MKLDEIGVYSIGYAFRGSPAVAMPEGWSGPMDDVTGIACLPVGEREGKQAFLLHCPWRKGTGITYQEFSFQLPKVRQILLRGATALQADAVGKSDGVTFRLYVDGRKLLDSNRADAKWQPYSFDLTDRAGKVVRIRFETDPGPKDNPSFDFALWGDRELVLEGYRAPAPRHVSPLQPSLKRLAATRNGSVVPLSGFAGKVSVSGKGDVATLAYSGPDGKLTYRWRRPKADERSLLGNLSLSAVPAKGPSVVIPLAGSSRLDWLAEAKPGDVAWSVSGGQVRLSRAYEVRGKQATLEVTGKLVGKSLVMDVALRGAEVSALQGGVWGPVLRRKPLQMPYYSGQAFYLPQGELFVNAFLDWTASNASAQDGTRAYYSQLTDGSHNPLRERLIYSAAWHPMEVMPNLPNPPSPFLKDLGGRVVLDTWGGRYTDIARELEHLAAIGVKDCVTLIHVWQRSGYDNALPAHLPAMESLGGDPGMKTLVETARRLGHRIALHENYVDYYPNYEGFKDLDIALAPDGVRVPAWYNPGTKIQSFAVKPNAILPLAATQSPEIHRRFDTNACYLDVHSAVPPWFHVDARAGEKGAGTFERVWDVHRELFDYERGTHQGPVFGEGNNHWYWSGYLDGAEAQFGAGWPANQGRNAPLLVDFDLLRMHPLSVNHGMGYYERWWDKAVWGASPPVQVLDQYRMQEVLYGHAGFLAQLTWSIPCMAWLEHHLLTPVTDRYAGKAPEAISYLVNGRWVGTDAAVKAAKLDQARVRYPGGLTLTGNNSSKPMKVGDQVLPRFGWVAEGSGVRAYTAQRGGVLVDYAETRNSVFANARRAADWNVAGVRRVRPRVASLEQAGPRVFTVTYEWDVQDRLPSGLTCLVHFSRPPKDSYDEGIAFQNDHQLALASEQWKPGSQVKDGPYTVTLPESVSDGDYGWYIGLYTLTSGNRVPLLGADDGRGRIRLGTLRVRDGGKSITLVADPLKESNRLGWYSANLNSKDTLVDFGPLRTDGSVLLKRQGPDWVLLTMPTAVPFVVELSGNRFGRPSAVRSRASAAPKVAGAKGKGWWRLPVTGSQEYRWTASPGR
jgi:hypothetical protein